MPQDDEDRNDEKAAPQQAAFPRVRNFFKVPGPVRQLFNTFPLITYPANDLPQRSPRNREKHTLYVFTSRKGAQNGEPSFNPSCLKWQAYLKFQGVQFHTVQSTNHASPTGALPFLLPSTSTAPPSQESTLPIPSNQLQKWAREQGAMSEEPSNMRYDAYLSLIDHRIRNAWLYTLYLEPRNFTAVARRLYVEPCSSSSLVSATIAHQLRAAAEAELLKHYTAIDIDDLYSEADHAVDALSILLGENEFFFGNKNPGLFDASMFAYTYLLLDEKMDWKEKKLLKALEKHQNLVQHRQRIHKRYFVGSK